MTAGGAGISLQRVAVEEPTTLASPRAAPSNRFGGGRLETGDDSSPAVQTRARDRPGSLASVLYPFPLGTLPSIWTPGQRAATPRLQSPSRNSTPRAHGGCLSLLYIVTHHQWQAMSCVC